MMDKRLPDLATAVARIEDGARLMIGGFGSAGIPFGLIDALLDHGAKGLTVISNNAGAQETGIAKLLKEGRVAKVICSYPRSPGSIWFERRYEAGEIELEVVPQGTLAERIRAAGAGIGGFLTPTAYGTLLAEGKETRVIDGRGYVMEMPLHADVALLRADRADKWGNLTFHGTARNFNPVMASAAKYAVAEVRKLSDVPLDPERVVTPGIFVQGVVEYGVRP
ncbi:3-oxoacid CoA-transferase subunit A [Pontibrevibacter nitratireducens]|uniref:3-oxoacid CoA-transferase subunit A n=2 Tax=Pontivivens nitratireducens TaxID=2758038 RepID=A0A6G7VKE6_9RHOB|nr:3-oxoacid CoA-transferase subunit A [Pontibrevibacter nitratireducens]